MNDATAAFLTERIGSYYASNPPLLVQDLSNREWMFKLASDATVRHLRFHTQDELRAWLAKAPRGVWHSAAYYKRPDARVMKEKDLQEAEVFIDIDTPPGPLPQKYGPPDKALATAKLYAQRTIQVLEEECGLTWDDMIVSFSGSKGYHVRIQDPEYVRMESDPRRSLGVFISGDQVNLLDLFPNPVNHKAVMWPTTRPDPGLRRRMWDGMTALWATRNDPESHAGVFNVVRRGGKYEDAEAKWFFRMMRQSDSIESFLNAADSIEDVSKIVKLMSCPELDLPVIQDLSKLPRLIGGIHGATGLRTTRIHSAAELDAFDPYIDANPWSMTRPIQIQGTATRGFMAKGKAVKIREGETRVLREAFAMPFLCAGFANFVTADVEVPQAA